MKSITVFILILIANATLSIAQANDHFIRYPFQVLYQKNILINGKESVENLQFIARNELLNVLDSGVVVLVHFTGKVFEFEGVQHIDVQQINPKVSAIYHNQFNRPDLLKLYNHKHREDNFILWRGSSERQNRDCTIHLGYPTSIERNKFYANNESKLLLTWYPSKRVSFPKYKLQIVNIFDEVLYEKELDETRITMDLNNFEEDQLILYRLSMVDRNNKECYSRSMAIELNNEQCDCYFENDSLESMWQYLVFGLVNEGLSDFNYAKENYIKAMKKAEGPYLQLAESNYESFLKALQNWKNSN